MDQNVYGNDWYKLTKLVPLRDVMVMSPMVGISSSK